MTKTVFHYTDSARLPWILEAGELRPGQNKIGGYPDPDFIWATTSPKGDGTATSSWSGGHFRSGELLHVRFTLSQSDFIPWNDVPSIYPQWTSEQRTRLADAAKGKSDPSDWWCRAVPLRLESAIAIEVKSYANNSWRPVSRDFREIRQDGVRWLGVPEGRKLYVSRQIFGPAGQAGYNVGYVSLDE